ncbi:MAG: CAP domain-containing protein, partial [Bacilli bacterium]|nr:CAP domain-containing protein [Bacilli bacterium]
PSAPSDIRALETEVIRLVNAERSRAGQPTLTENNEVSRVARTKSQDFINNNYFSHNSPTYGSPFEMLRSFGVSYTAAAENIARGQRTAEEVMNTWMNSSGHRANILNSTYNQIGVGVARDNNGTLYWTQMFIRS